ncbi:hypothetical protein HDE_03781 [Halotydeus destructor]|nr:hypothetical protein HDE_03781 [Halotydeus destructor]
MSKGPEMPPSERACTTYLYPPVVKQIPDVRALLANVRNLVSFSIPLLEPLSEDETTPTKKRSICVNLDDEIREKRKRVEYILRETRLDSILKYPVEPLEPDDEEEREPTQTVVQEVTSDYFSENSCLSPASGIQPLPKSVAEDLFMSDDEDTENEPEEETYLSSSSPTSAPSLSMPRFTDVLAIALGFNQLSTVVEKSKEPDAAVSTMKIVDLLSQKERIRRTSHQHTTSYATSISKHTLRLLTRISRAPSEPATPQVTSGLPKTFIPVKRRNDFGQLFSGLAELVI